MQPLPEFRSSFFNPTSYHIVLLLSMYQTDVKQYPLLPGQLPTQQPSEEHITCKVWGPKLEVWRSTSPAPAIFTPNSGNRSMCSLSHKAPASSFSLLNQDSFQAQTHIPPLPLTNQVFPHFKCVNANSLQYCLTVAIHQAPLSMGFSRQEYWLGCHALLQGIFQTQGSNLHVLHLCIGRWVLYH